MKLPKDLVFTIDFRTWIESLEFDEEISDKLMNGTLGRTLRNASIIQAVD